MCKYLKTLTERVGAIGFLDAVAVAQTLVAIHLLPFLLFTKIHIFPLKLSREGEKEEYIEEVVFLKDMTNTLV